MLLAYLGNAVNVSKVKLHRLLISVKLQIFSRADAVGFITAHVYFFTSEGCGGGQEHFLYKGVGLFALAEQNARGVLNIRCLCPFKIIAHVTERLHTRNDLYSQGIGIIVNSLQLIKGIPSAHMTEIGSALQLIHIFHIKLKLIKAEECHVLQPLLGAFYSKGRAEGNVHHTGKSFKGRSFLNEKATLFILLCKNAKESDETIFRITSNYGRV